MPVRGSPCRARISAARAIRRPTRADFFKAWTLEELLGADLTLKWIPRVGRLLNQPSALSPRRVRRSSLTSRRSSRWGSRPDFHSSGGSRSQSRTACSCSPEKAAGFLTPRRIDRICESYGIDRKEVPLFAVFDTAPISSHRFREAFTRTLEEHKPDLVILDPYYTYHRDRRRQPEPHRRGRSTLVSLRRV